MNAPYRAVLCVAIVILMVPDVVNAQRSIADVLGREATPEGQVKTALEEVMLFSYIENSYTFNLSGAGRGGSSEGPLASRGGAHRQAGGG